MTARNPLEVPDVQGHYDWSWSTNPGSCHLILSSMTYIGLHISYDYYTGLPASIVFTKLLKINKANREDSNGI